MRYFLIRHGQEDLIIRLHDDTDRAMNPVLNNASDGYVVAKVLNGFDGRIMQAALNDKEYGHVEG